MPAPLPPDLLQELRDRIRGIEGVRDCGRPDAGVPTGFAALDRPAVVRPDGQRAALWAWEESLRAPGVAVTFGRLGAVTDRVVRRLQLAVEAGGGLGFLVRPPGCPAGSVVATRVV